MQAKLLGAGVERRLLIHGLRHLAQPGSAGGYLGSSENVCQFSHLSSQRGVGLGGEVGSDCDHPCDCPHLAELVFSHLQNGDKSAAFMGQSGRFHLQRRAWHLGPLGVIPMSLSCWLLGDK